MQEKTDGLYINHNFNYVIGKILNGLLILTDFRILYVKIIESDKTELTE